MQKHSRMVEKKWRVLTLSEMHNADKQIIPIQGSKFKQVKREMIQKGYRRKHTIGEEAKYDFGEIK